LPDTDREPLLLAYAGDKNTRIAQWAVYTSASAGPSTTFQALEDNLIHSKMSLAGEIAADDTLAG
jgi:hypothetical protein